MCLHIDTSYVWIIVTPGLCTWNGHILTARYSQWIWETKNQPCDYNTVILPTTLLYLPGPMALTLTIPLLIIVVSRVNLRILLTRRCMVLGKSPCIVLYVLGIGVQIFLIHEKWMTIIYITLKKIDCHKNMNPQNVASQATKI